MEIRVKGTGERSFAPDQVNLRLAFHEEGESYDEVLAEGVKNVRSFIETILAQNDFTAENMKTSSFVVRENRVYNEATRTWEKKGFVFAQDALLKFDYDKERLASMMEQISQIEHAPTYNVVFTIKDREAARRSLLAEAYNDAKLQAQSIADAAGARLQQCLRTDFQSNMPSFTSHSDFQARMKRSAMASDEMVADASVAENIVSAFTPEDVVVSETLYCLWSAE